MCDIFIKDISNIISEYKKGVKILIIGNSNTGKTTASKNFNNSYLRFDDVKKYDNISNEITFMSGNKIIINDDMDIIIIMQKTPINFRTYDEFYRCSYIFYKYITTKCI